MGDELGTEAGHISCLRALLQHRVLALGDGRTAPDDHGELHVALGGLPELRHDSLDQAACTGLKQRPMEPPVCFGELRGGPFTWDGIQLVEGLSRFSELLFGQLRDRAFGYGGLEETPQVVDLRELFDRERCGDRAALRNVLDEAFCLKAPEGLSDRDMGDAEQFLKHAKPDPLTWLDSPRNDLLADAHGYLIDNRLLQVSGHRRLSKPYPHRGRCLVRRWTGRGTSRRCRRGKACRPPRPPHGGVLRPSRRPSRKSSARPMRAAQRAGPPCRQPPARVPARRARPCLRSATGSPWAHP